jgi:hypothetical protein
MNILKSLSLAVALLLPLAAQAQRPATPFTDAELDQMLAPIALYPDSVLSHVLIAATVPEDVEAAADWVDRHPDVRGQQAVDAVERYDWDPSVKALVAFPEVIERMDEDPDWTEDLGLAFLDQEEAVMDRVQALRDRAYDNGSLDDLEHVRVVREREYIYIEPAVTRVVYVPYYDPWRVYGHWYWASYPPHCWNWWAGRPVGHYYGSSFWWGVSFRAGPTWYAGSFNWPYRHVVVTRPHRYYAPSPGYSGRSSMRRENVAHRDSRSGARNPGHRSPGRSDEHRRDVVRRDPTPVRRGHERHDEGDTHRPQGHQGNRGRRSSTEVRAALSARRDSSAHDNRRNGPAWTADARRPDDARLNRSSRSVERGRVESPRASRAESRPQPQVERSRGRSAESRPEPRGESRSESRGESRSESRSESRGGGRGEGGSRGNGREARR